MLEVPHLTNTIGELQWRSTCQLGLDCLDPAVQTPIRRCLEEILLAAYLEEDWTASAHEALRLWDEVQQEIPAQPYPLLDFVIGRYVPEHRPRARRIHGALLGDCRSAEEVYELSIEFMELRFLV